MEQNLPQLPPVILRAAFTTSCGASSIIPAFCRRSRTPQRTSCWKPSYARWAEAQGIDEDLKARDQMAWVGAMNNIKSAALEILRESK